MKRFNQWGFLALALVALLAATPALAAPLDTNRDATINGEYRFQQDVTFQEGVILDNAPVEVKYSNGTDYIYEKVSEPYPASFYDEFLGMNATFPNSGNTASYAGMWFMNGTGDGQAYLRGDVPPGVATLALNGSSGVQSAAMLWNDNLSLDISKGLVFEARVAVNDLPDYPGSVSFGLMGNYTNPDPMANGWFAMFDIGGSAINNSGVNATTYDGVTHTNASTGITASADYKVYRIETDTNKVVRYFVDGAEVAATSAPTWGTAGGRLFVQPFFNVSTPSGATNALSSNGSIRLDFLRVAQKSR